MIFKPQNPRIECADGTSLSVQCSRFTYCSPREDEGPYWEMEVGFIKKDGHSVSPPESWREYADGDFPNNVYGYVPAGLVEEFLLEHGGIVSGKLPQ